MKKKILLAFISFLLIQFSYAQSVDLQISRIEKIKENINNNIENLKEVKAFKDETGFRYVYKEGHEIKLIKVQYIDKKETSNTIKKNVEWYFLNEKLIYARQIWTNPTDNKVIDEQTSYLNGDQMIAWVDKDNNRISEQSKEFLNMESKLVKFGEELIENNK